MSKHQQAIDLLLKTKDGVKSILSDPIDQNHALRIDSDLQKIINTLSLTTGHGGFVTEKASTPGPATTFMGEKLEKQTVTPPEAIKPTPDQVNQLKDQIEVAFKSFPDTDSEQILSTVDEVVIRGVAKKAGVKGISKDNPKEITVVFIDEVKETIKKSSENK